MWQEGSKNAVVPSTSSSVFVIICCHMSRWRMKMNTAKYDQKVDTEYLSQSSTYGAA